ncbi:heavy-metal-associated domain-containing protein [Polynucleobacter sp. AP-Nino-20-G2]|uniref:heavy-metal-associated domain-containing protein n=1 Tax=Polynucleobacter sp. AP-Nino-20-G2 TaxID=2576917 RepID=UPI001BFEBF8E|nr:heavy-metal-associated domain-containing protein [Polynucleobacter sp. AP-Nino-20-G2]
MASINLNVQGISSASCIQIITKALKSLSDISSIHVDWESGRVQVLRLNNESSDIIHLLNQAGYHASLDLDEQ